MRADACAEAATAMDGTTDVLCAAEVVIADATMSINNIIECARNGWRTMEMRSMKYTCF